MRRQPRFYLSYNRSERVNKSRFTNTFAKCICFHSGIVTYECCSRRCSSLVDELLILLHKGKQPSTSNLQTDIGVFLPYFGSFGNFPFRMSIRRFVNRKVRSALRCFENSFFYSKRLIPIVGGKFRLREKG